MEAVSNHSTQDSETFWTRLPIRIRYQISGNRRDSSAMLRPALQTKLSKMAGNEQGYAADMNNAYISVGNILGPTLAGFLFDVNMFAPFVAGSLYSSRHLFNSIK